MYGYIYVFSATHRLTQHLNTCLECVLSESSCKHIITTKVMDLNKRKVKLFISIYLAKAVVDSQISESEKT